MLESLFNKAEGLKAYNSIKKKLQHRCFPVKLTKIFDRRVPLAASEVQLMFSKDSEQKPERLSAINTRFI